MISDSDSKYTSVLAADDLDTLVQALRQAGFQVVAPTVAEQAIVYAQIDSAADLPRGWGDRQEQGRYRLVRRGDDAYFGYNVGPQSWKKYLQLPKRQLWKSHRNADGLQFQEITEEPVPLAFLGVRSCELHAMAIQDRVFMPGEYRNADYSARREAIFIVAVNCTTAADTCFCTSMNTGPKVTLGCDLELTEIINDREHYFLLRSGSAQGANILRQLPLAPAHAAQLAQQQTLLQQLETELAEHSRAFDSSDLQALLYRNYDSPAWDTVAERCLSCANCTMVCPTCFCTTEVDTSDLSGDHAERWQYWDSCFNGDFSYVHGGTVRASTRSRYRQWMTHKLATWYDQFGSSGCVGCGRCIAWCPVGIDITEEIQHIRDSDQT